MAFNTAGSLPATDGSDILNVQINTSPSGGSTNIAIRGYPIEQGGYVASLKVTNTRVGEFTGNH